jgi:tetratricopeptide (TPR) repeat protein
MRLRFFFTILVAKLACAATAFAAGQSDRDTCNSSRDADARIAACTATVEDQKESAQSRATAYKNRAAALARKRELDRAVADFNAALRLDPKDASAYKARGEIFEQKKDYDRAIQDFGEAIRLAPNDDEAFHDRGGAYFSKRDYDRAIKDASEAIRLNPKDPGHHFARGNYWNGRGFGGKGDGDKDKDRAIQDYSEAIRLGDIAYVDKPGAPTNEQRTLHFIRSMFYGGRARVWMDKGDFDHAVADYNEMIRLRPDESAYYIGRGDAHLSKGEHGDVGSEKDAYDLAIKDFTESIRLDPDWAPAYDRRGIAYFLAGDFTAASTDFLHRISVEPDSDSALWLYLASKRLGRDGKAELAANAARLKKRDPMIDFYLGRRSMDELISDLPNPFRRCEAAFYIGEWHLANGNSSEAKKAFQDAPKPCPASTLQTNAAVAELKRLK